MKAKGVLSEQDAEDASAEHGGGPQPTHRRHRQLQRQARSSQVGRISVQCSGRVAAQCGSDVAHCG